MRDELTPAEQDTLLTSRPVADKMLTQWDASRDSATHNVRRGVRMWQQIRKETIDRQSMKKMRLYQTVAWAASLLLLFGISGAAYFLMQREAPTSYYTISTGIQTIDNIELPDGTTIQLGSGTKLTYPAVFAGNTREITLDGQAFMQVVPDAQKPFVVHTTQMDVEVLGTSFEVFAYNHEENMETILLNGKVKVNFPAAGKEAFELTADDKIAYHKSENKVVRSKVNAENYTSWRKGVLSFENEKLSMIVPRLEQWYGRKIYLEKELGESYKFTFKVRDEPLDRILYIMGESSPVRYSQLEGGDYTLFLK